MEKSSFSSGKKKCFPSESVWSGVCYHCNGTGGVKKDAALLLKWKSVMPQCSLCRAANKPIKCKWPVQNGAAAAISNRHQVADAESQATERNQQKLDGAPPEFTQDERLGVKAIPGYRKADPVPARDREVDPDTQKPIAPRRKFIQFVGCSKKQCSWEVADGSELDPEDLVGQEIHTTSSGSNRIAYLDFN